MFKKSVLGNTYVPEGKVIKGSDVDYAANIPLDAVGVKDLQQIAHEAVDEFYKGEIK